MSEASDLDGKDGRLREKVGSGRRRGEHRLRLSVWEAGSSQVEPDDHKVLE